MVRDRNAFTLVELLVVVAIIALIAAILLPALAKARQSSLTVTCQNNLRQCGIAFTSYAQDCQGLLPYPTTTFGEGCLWYNCIDPYFQSLPNNARSGVAADRSYTLFKQCPIIQDYVGSSVDYGGAGAQNDTTEFARTYKINAMLRRDKPYAQAKLSRLPHPSQFVVLGDGVSIDYTGPIPSQWESGQFSMEVDDSTQANPALRHAGGANILFVDGHVECVVLPTITKTLRVPQNNIAVQTWQSEYLLNGVPYNPPAG